jgi:signal transduction histidine kinase
MRLAPRLVLAFGFVATLSVAGLGIVVREEQRDSETQRFQQEVASACDRVVAELARQGESDRKLIAGACQSGELVDRALIWLQAGGLDDEKRLALSRLVPEERQAFDLDELLLATADGDLLGRDPMPRVPLSRAETAKVLVGDPAHFALRAQPGAAVVSRCRKPAAGTPAVALLGARRLEPLLDRLGKTVDARVSLGVTGAVPPPVEDTVQASCPLSDAKGQSVAVVVAKSKKELAEHLARIDQTIAIAALAAAAVALGLAALFARSLGKPIADLAAEARKVVSGEARPLGHHGTGEIADLTLAFDTMLVDLEATRRRLAATSRIAAWREVARRVAHEVKNPLAPIQAAVETLRRLRARGDPQFEEYFDEASKTVLDEVHRISNIVTEFTRFARLPPPRPQEVDLGDLARQVARLHTHEASGHGAQVHVIVGDRVPRVRADRDQIIQVLTNLVQNALDAVAGQGGQGDQARAGEVRVTVAREGDDHVTVTVKDNGPGVSPDFAPRLFEPYATTKKNGTGLGLAVAQRIAVEHGGELSLEGWPGGPGEPGDRLRAEGAPNAANGQSQGSGATFRLLLRTEGPRIEEAPSSGNTP